MEKTSTSFFSNVEEFINWVENQKRFSPKVSLAKMEYWSKLIGSPHERLPFIHVTGTNGKGSTVAFLSQLLRSSGLNVGSFVSPYVTYFNERIMNNGVPISDESLLKHANYIRHFYDREHPFDLPTFFEFLTLLAFRYFADPTNHIDIVVCEVGMGGLLDSTNIITPLLSIITNVTYDHMSILGNSLEAILEQKLGIVKRNVPLVTYIKDEKLRERVKSHTDALGSKVVFASDEKYDIKHMTIDKTVFVTPTFGEMTIHLPGFHQIENAITALMAFNEIKDRLFQKSKNANISLIYKQGLAKTTWPGRLETLSTKPLIIIDGAHNVDGVKRVSQLIKELNYPFKRCVFACSDDKEKAAMIELLEPYFEEVIFTAFSYKRHSNAEDLFAMSKHQRKLLITDLDQIVSYVFENHADLTLFIGSLYFVSEMRPKIINYQAK